MTRLSNTVLMYGGVELPVVPDLYYKTVWQAYDGDSAVGYPSGLNADAVGAVGLRHADTARLDLDDVVIISADIQAVRLFDLIEPYGIKLLPILGHDGKVSAPLIYQI